MRLFTTAGLIFIAAGALAEPRFSVSFPSNVFAGPFSGRVVVYLSKQSQNPRMGPDWMNPEPMFSAPFHGISAGQVMVISDRNATCFPAGLSKVDGDYFVQAVVDRNLGGRAIGGSEGNLFSTSTKVHFEAGSNQEVPIVCDQVVPPATFVETETVKVFKVRSALLSKFYGRPTEIKAAVALPDPSVTKGAKLPVVYEIPGFGGSYTNFSGSRQRINTSRNGQSFIHVLLDPNVPTGHCVFADSANNGPWGKALTTEFIPAFERKFPAIAKPSARLLRGHSSGGWSSLWLQVAYPSIFGGVWSTSPDMVDFHHCQTIDIYAPGANAFFSSNGTKVPIAREGDKPILYFKDFSDMEAPIRGEQLGSFNAVFSPRGEDGQPKSMWDPATGAVRPDVAQTWMKYDISLILRTNWKTLGPKLKGKIHIYCGDLDTFYLDSAVRALQDQMKTLGSDATIEIVPGNHFTMFTPALSDRVDREMADQIKKARL